MFDSTGRVYNDFQEYKNFSRIPLFVYVSLHWTMDEGEKRRGCARYRSTEIVTSRPSQLNLTTILRQVR